MVRPLSRRAPPALEARPGLHCCWRSLYSHLYRRTERPSQGRPICDQQKLTMDVWVGGDTDMLDRVGLGDIVPGTIIIDQQGEIIGRIMGEAREEDVKARVDWLLHG